MILCYWVAEGRDLIFKEGDFISHVPEPKYTDFEQKISIYSFGNDFLHFCVKISNWIWVLS